MKKRIKHIINALIKRGYWYNHEFFDGCRRMNNYATFNTDVINLGSTSAVHAFNYDGLKLKAGNWAMNRNPFLGDYAILTNYSSFLKEEGAVVIITLCPFSALAGSYNFFDDRYYTILYPSSIPNYSYTNDIIVKSRWNSPFSHYPIYGLLSDLWHLCIKERNKILSESELQNDANTKMYSWMHEFSIKDFSKPLSLKNQDAINDAATILNNIIKYCYHKHATPVLVLPPMYHTLADKFTPEIRNVLIGQLLTKINDKTVCFLNYMDNPLFLNDRSLFKDSFLLNKKGASLFTRQILSDLHII